MYRDRGTTCPQGQAAHQRFWDRRPESIAAGDLPLPDAAEPDAVPTPASGPPPQSPAGPNSPEAALRLPSIEPFADGEPGTAGRRVASCALQHVQYCVGGDRTICSQCHCFCNLEPFNTCQVASGRRALFGASFAALRVQARHGCGKATVSRAAAAGAHRAAASAAGAQCLLPRDPPLLWGSLRTACLQCGCQRAEGSSTGASAATAAFDALHC